MEKGAESADVQGGTIEDYLSELVDHLSIAERRRFCRSVAYEVIIDGVKYNVEDLTSALEELKQAIAFAINVKNPKIHDHRSFIRAVHRALQSGKAGEGATVDYFVLNYDTLIEDALGLERLTVADGFSGAATGWWDPESFRTPHVNARVFKIHGSIDWRLMDNEVLPHRVRIASDSDKDLGKTVVIWPAATKYRETQRDPYAQILKYMRTTLRPREKSELVLTTCGYRFADSHINLELDRALRESGQGLTIVAFTDDLSPKEQLKQWLDDKSVRDQVRVYAKGGFFHGSTSIVSPNELPWWKFEVLTRLLGGER